MINILENNARKIGEDLLFALFFQFILYKIRKFITKMKIEDLIHSPLIFGYTILKHEIDTKQIIDNKIPIIIKSIKWLPKSLAITANSCCNFKLSFLLIINTLLNLPSSIKKKISYQI